MRNLTVALLVCGGVAVAQESALQDKLKKQMEEISRLMRDSERRLLEMTKVDVVVEKQRQIVAELRKLLEQPPPTADHAAAQGQERDRRKEELEQQQAELVRKLEEIFEGQKQSAEQTVKELEELLRSLPRQPGAGQGQPDRNRRRQEQDRQKRLRDEQEERTQKEPRSPRQKRDQRKDQPTGSQRRKDQTEAAARLRRIEAWIARLPPEDQERINRNDFSTIPHRYRRLVREYTALRAKREAERDAEDR
jgi:chromosome segregation ATPase